MEGWVRGGKGSLSFMCVLGVVYLLYLDVFQLRKISVQEIV